MKGKQQQQSKASSWLAPWKWKLKRRHRRQIAAAADVVLAGLVSGGMALAVVVLLQRLMKVGDTLPAWHFLAAGCDDYRTKMSGLLQWANVLAPTALF
jgi:hypothetical protein